jgi:quinoprotein glucose dehydrogenase
LLAAAGGIWLTILGGSFAYILIGLALLVTGFLLWQGRALALWVYAATLILALIWAVREAGLDWWALAPRGDVLAVLGVVLVLPWVAGRLGPRRGPAWMALGAALAVVLITALVAMFSNPHDISGSLPESRGEGTLPASVNVPDGEWHAYGRTNYGQRYSPLSQLTPDNVDKLQMVWKYNTGDIRGEGDPGETTYEVTPLKVGNSLYFCTPHNLVVSLDAETGKENWTFNPQIPDVSKPDAQHLICHGLAYYDGSQPPQAASAPAPESATEDLANAEAKPADCVQRLFVPTADGRLISLSAKTGQTCPGFWVNMPNVLDGS